jgi:2-polyprenyl-6-methoxyphenol hydroxylase-like FAD-dependent oxidoreductase
VQVLAGRAAAYHTDLRWGHALTGFEQHAEGVTVQVSGPDGQYQLTAAYLVGADGGTSTTRKLARIDFPGISSHDVIGRMAADVLPPDGWVDPETGALDIPGFGRIPSLQFRRTERGLFIWASLAGRSMIGSVELDGAPDDDPAREEQAEQVAQLTLPELQASIERVLGVDVPLRPPARDAPVDFRRFAGINSRIASCYTAGRVILVGDAAHVHSPLGGPGLNVGLQDAVNLGWKLAGVVQGRYEPTLLETYEAERRPVAERVIMHSRAQLALIRPSSEVTALRELFGELLADPDVVRRLSDLLSGADVRYPAEAGAHPLVGLWVPDLTIEKHIGTSRVAELGRDGRPLLLDFTGDGVLAAATSGIRDSVTVVAGRPVEPVAATALLVRPDGYVAWAWSATKPTELPDLKALDRVLRHWFGIAALGSQGASSVSA